MYTHSAEVTVNPQSWLNCLSGMKYTSRPGQLSVSKTSFEMATQLPQLVCKCFPAWRSKKIHVDLIQNLCCGYCHLQQGRFDFRINTSVLMKIYCDNNVYLQILFGNHN